MRYIFDSIGLHLQTFLRLSCLTFSTNYIRDLEDFVCKIGRTKLVKFQRRKTKMIDSQHPGQQWPLPTSVVQGVLVDMLLGQTGDGEEEDKVESEGRST